VIDPGRGVPGWRVKEKEQEREEEAKREAEILLIQFVDHLARKEVNIKKEVEESDTVAKSIICYAKKNNMDVIVIGTKGMTAVEDF
jgi:nucleotide-binding universal stress UspA family protein